MSIFTQRHYQWLAAYVKGREWSQSDILHLAVTRPPRTPVWLASLAMLNTGRPHRHCQWCQNLAWLVIGLLAGPLLLLLALSLWPR